MVKKYIFAIDETGSFHMRHGDSSFVCGILIDGSEGDLRKAYVKTYEDFKFPLPAPNNVKELLTQNDSYANDNDDNARFHFIGLSSEQKNICKNNLLCFVNKIFKSKGQPIVFANNQNWWQIAIIVVIRKFLKETKFEPNSEIEIWIDNRNPKVWGIDSDNNSVVSDDTFRSYHDILKLQIEKSVKNYIRRDCKLNIHFLSDTSSFYINLADITCGFIRTEKDNLNIEIEECLCQTYTDDSDPLVYIEREPMLAYNLIMQEVIVNEFINVESIKTLISRLRKDKGHYEIVWDTFYDMLKYKIKARDHQSDIVKLKQVVAIFLNELTKLENTLSSAKKLDMMILLIEYYSHIGDNNLPINKEFFLTELYDQCSRHGETRLLRKWEKMVSYSLREAQIYFNNYCFEKVSEEFYNLNQVQNDIISVLRKSPFRDLSEKDEPSTAILGTIGQAYAYEGNLDEALVYFEMSKELAIRSTSRTDSYIFNIYHHKCDVKKCREAFCSQSGMTPEEYAQKKDFSDQWVLLSYCKLIALELYINKSTELPIPYSNIVQSQNDEYPFPLILKWLALSMYLKDPGNNINVEQALNRACEQLLNESNGFAIKSLVLPVIQCYSMINNQNPYHKNMIIWSKN